MSERSLGDIAAARKKKSENKVADIVLKDLGISATGLAELAGTDSDEIRKSIVEALKRQELYNVLYDNRAAEDEARGLPADRCCNMVCGKYRQSDGWESDPRGARYPLLPISDRHDFCTEGASEAQGCMFRMTEKPPNALFEQIPSHAEAVRMLQRAGLLQPDEHGKYNGTDFAFHNATRKLWFAYCDMLVKTGRIGPEDFDIAHDIFCKENA